MRRKAILQLEPILERWRQLSTTLASAVTVSSPGRRVEGKAVDIDQDGALLVRRASDTESVCIVAGDVSLRKNVKNEGGVSNGR